MRLPQIEHQLLAGGHGDLLTQYLGAGFPILSRQPVISRRHIGELKGLARLHGLVEPGWSSHIPQDDLNLSGARPGRRLHLDLPHLRIRRRGGRRLGGSDCRRPFLLRARGWSDGRRLSQLAGAYQPAPGRLKLRRVRVPPGDNEAELLDGLLAASQMGKRGAEGEAEGDVIGILIDRGLVLGYSGRILTPARQRIPFLSELDARRPRGPFL